MVMVKYKVQEKRSKKAQWKNTYRYNFMTGKRIKITTGTSKARALLYVKAFKQLNRILPEKEFYKLRIVPVKSKRQKTKRR